MCGQVQKRASEQALRAPSIHCIYPSLEETETASTQGARRLWLLHRIWLRALPPSFGALLQSSLPTLSFPSCQWLALGWEGGDGAEGRRMGGGKPHWEAEGRGWHLPGGPGGALAFAPGAAVRGPSARGGGPAQPGGCSPGTRDRSRGSSHQESLSASVWGGGDQGGVDQPLQPLGVQGAPCLFANRLQGPSRTPIPIQPNTTLPDTPPRLNYLRSGSRRRLGSPVLVAQGEFLPVDVLLGNAKRKISDFDR